MQMRVQMQVRVIVLVLGMKFSQRRSLMSGVVGSVTGDDSPQNWRTSSRSYGNGACVEVAGPSLGGIRVRDSVLRQGPVLQVTPAGWSVFLGQMRGGGFPRS
jgi:hypothetical protein